MKKRANTKKVLFLARRFHPYIGGVEKHVHEISKELIKKGYEITVITERIDKKLSEKEQYNGINIIRLPIGENNYYKKFFIWKWIIKNRKFIQSFDIIHVHDVFFWLYPLLISLNRNKVFITFHGYESYPIPLKNKTIRKMAEEYCAKNICVGDFMKKWYWVKPDIVTYGAVEKPESASKTATKKHSAVFFGRLDSQTGILMYYKAFLKLKRQYKDFSFEVIGEGELSNKMKNVTISPFKSAIANYVQKSRFVFVSRYLSMLEAMLNKRLVIAVYDNPVKKDYLLNSPFKKYVEICRSAEGIARKVEYYINNPDKEREMVDKAYKWAKKQTWEGVADTYLRLWETN